jgi:hypothetical protein
MLHGSGVMSEFL